MKYITLLLALVLSTSCSIKAEAEYNRRYWELKTKTIELEYLEKLNRTEDLVKINLFLIEIDSLRKEFKTTLK